MKKESNQEFLQLIEQLNQQDTIVYFIRLDQKRRFSKPSFLLFYFRVYCIMEKSAGGKNESGLYCWKCKEQWEH